MKVAIGHLQVFDAWSDMECATIFAVNIRNVSKPRANKRYRGPLGDSGYSDGVYRGADGGGCD